MQAQGGQGAQAQAQGEQGQAARGQDIQEQAHKLRLFLFLCLLAVEWRPLKPSSAIFAV